MAEPLFILLQGSPRLTPHLFGRSCSGSRFASIIITSTQTSRYSCSWGPNLKEGFNPVDFHRIQAIRRSANLVFLRLLFRLTCPLLFIRASFVLRIEEDWWMQRIFHQFFLLLFFKKKNLSLQGPPFWQRYTSRLSKSDFSVFCLLIEEGYFREISFVLLECRLQCVHIHLLTSANGLKILVVFGAWLYVC